MQGDPPPPPLSTHSACYLYINKVTCVVNFNPEAGLQQYKIELIWIVSSLLASFFPFFLQLPFNSVVYLFDENCLHLHDGMHTGSLKHETELLVIKFTPANIPSDMQITV